MESNAQSATSPADTATAGTRPGRHMIWVPLAAAVVFLGIAQCQLSAIAPFPSAYTTRISQHKATIVLTPRIVGRAHEHFLALVLRYDTHDGRTQRLDIRLPVHFRQQPEFAPHKPLLLDFEIRDGKPILYAVRNQRGGLLANAEDLGKAIHVRNTSLEREAMLLRIIAGGFLLASATLWLQRWRMQRAKRKMG